MNKTRLNYSKSEEVAYLIYKGFQYVDMYKKENKRYKGSYKIFFVFEEDKEELINVISEFNSTATICLKEYIEILCDIKKKINKTMNN